MGHNRSVEEQRRLKKLYMDTRTTYRGGAYYDDSKGRYVRWYNSRTPGYTKMIRRWANKKVRRMFDNLSHGLYKRAFDYWWKLD